MEILIVEDEMIVAENIATILENEGYHICGISAEGKEALEVIQHRKPSLVICDIQIKGELNGIELARKLKDFYEVPFLYLTAFADENTLRQAASTKPTAYLVKPFTEKQLVTAVNMALLENFVGDPLNQGIEPPPTKRETEILSLMAMGKSSKQIAEILVLSEHTIQTHRKNLIQKYQVNNSSELIMLAVKKKWIKIR